MASGNGAVHESVDVVGRPASAVMPAVQASLQGVPGLQVAPVGNGSIHCVRTRRPTWATFAGAFGLLFFGLGILFFFVKKTDTCTITVVDGPRGAVVTISGNLDERSLGRVRTVLDPATPPPPTPQHRPVEVAEGGSEPAATAAATPPPPAVPVDAERTVARTPPAAFRVRFDHGPIAEVVTSVLVGRDPAADVGVQGAVLLAVPDPTLSISKTHLLLRAHEGRLWVDDLHSTNGTSIVHPGGERVVASPGNPTAVPPGAVIEFGERRAEVLVG